MSQVLARGLMRWLVLGLLALAVLVLNGCTQREATNPFVGPYGASGNSPFGG